MSGVMMKVLQIQNEVLTRQVETLGPENERVRNLLTEFDKRHDADQAEIERLRDAFTWSLRHTSGKELRRMVGDLHDTSDLDEFVRAIERAKSR